MLLTLLSLVCPGFFLVQRTWAQVGVYRKPSLSALPGALVKSGENVTLQCHSEIRFDTFIVVLHRQGVSEAHVYLAVKHHHGHSQGSLFIGPMTPAHAGTYTCYGSLSKHPYECSDPSDPVDIKIRDLNKKPSLSAQQGPVVMSGENVTLSCSSDHQFHRFHLSRDGVPQRWGLPAMHSHNGTFQANFLLGPVIQAETYRCYGSFNDSPHNWSHPSDPLHLSVTGSHLPPGGLKPSHVLIALSVTTILAFLVCFIHCWHSTQKNKSQEEAADAAITITDPDPEVDRTVTRQDAERKETQEVAYTNLDHCLVTQQTITPSSKKPKKSSTSISVYMEVMKC
ncbi:killer cell immunoglobulin-like receptor 2DS4 [Nannospalax galili]|uniref:killer cell immunoglobulin-like receptor 2DS4 n=1 Tax=Nannospalax galili TaxID=1026970 RepID=UPI00111C0FCC|nr:killer cell immunoglobulin-like receptor 2DS4 [Nannospalax galili]